MGKTEVSLDQIEVNGKTYVPVGPEQATPEMTDHYVIVRSRDAGVFAGEVESQDWDFIFDPCGYTGVESLVITKCRRLWYWEGAASLSELAMKGVGEPEKCQFPCEVSAHLVQGICEVLPCTKAAQQSIKSVPVWSANHG